MKKIIWIPVISTLVLSYCAANRMSTPGSNPGKGDSYVVCLARGVNLLEQKKYDEAIEALRRASELNSDSEKAFNFLGIGYFMKKDFIQAETCFLKALAANPAYSAAVCNLGNLQFEAGQIDTALMTLNKGVSDFPGDVALQFSLGNILLHQGDVEAGFAHLAKVIEIDPGYMEQERRFAQETSTGGAPRPEIFFRFASLYAAANQLEKTLAYLEKAKSAGFSDWQRIRQDDAFIVLRDDPQVKKYFE